jgi:hypothetical protein
VRTWSHHPQVREEIREVEGELYHRAENRMFRLFLTSIGRMEKILRTADDKSALRAVELLWTANGRIARGKDGLEIVNEHSQPMITDPADIRAAMSLLRKERERLEREKLEQRDPSAE